jgi:hypothetical protein
MTDRPRDTSLKDAFVGILMTVGPFFGVRYRPPRVEIPVVTTPATETEDDPPARPGSEPPSGGSARGGSEDGIVI